MQMLYKDADVDHDVDHDVTREPELPALPAIP